MSTDEHILYITRLTNERGLLESDLKEHKQNLSIQRKGRSELLEAQSVITKLFIDCSQEAREIIEIIINLALKSVFGEKYSFELNYEIKRNQVEANPILYKYGKPRRIQDECGEGVVDILSFGFRMAIWAISDEKSYSFSLDEPFKSISEGNQHAVGEMMRETFESLGIQCILTTHLQSFKDYLDKAYAVTEENESTGSKVTRISE